MGKPCGHTVANRGQTVANRGQSVAHRGTPWANRESGYGFVRKRVLLRYLAPAITFYEMQLEFQMMCQKTRNRVRTNIVLTPMVPNHTKRIQNSKIHPLIGFALDRNTEENTWEINTYCNTLL